MKIEFVEHNDGNETPEAIVELHCKVRLDQRFKGKGFKGKTGDSVEMLMESMSITSAKEYIAAVRAITRVISATITTNQDKDVQRLALIGVIKDLQEIVDGDNSEHFHLGGEVAEEQLKQEK